MLKLLGCDEAGLGAAAGDLVCAGCALPDDIVERLGDDARFLRDSKTLSLKQREKMAAIIRAHALFWKVEVVSVADINKHGIRWANLDGLRRIIESVEAEEYIVDGVLPPQRISRVRAKRIRSLPKADATVASVSAASILAKVTRDRLLAEVHASCPHCRAMGFDRNAGYLSPAHLEALDRLGPCLQHHRRVYVATALAKRRSSSATT